MNKKQAASKKQIPQPQEDEDFEGSDQTESDLPFDDGVSGADEESENETDRFIDPEDLADEEDARNFEEEDLDGEADEEGEEGDEDTPAGPKMLEITEERFASLRENIAKRNLASIKMTIKLFSFIFNERKLVANSVVYNVSHPKLLNTLMQLFFVDCSEQIARLPKSPRTTPVLRGFLKNVQLYLSKTESEPLAAFALKSLAAFYPLFLAFKTLNHKLIKTVLEAWGRYESFAAKLNAYVVIKKMFETNENEGRAYILKNFLQSFLRYGAGSSWRVYNNHIFMKNCVVDLVGVDIDISYVVLFDKVKELAAKITEISKRKVN